MVKRGVQTQKSEFVYKGIAGLGRRTGPYSPCQDCADAMKRYGWYWPESELGLPEAEYILVVEPVDWDTIPYA
jgi:hypothetical protein